MASFSGRVLIYGGRGALGSTCINNFKNNNWWVGSIDMYENEDAHSSVVVKAKDSLIDQEIDVLSGIETILGGEKVDALICVAGGWAGGNAADQDMIKNADLMWKQSVWTSLISARIAAKYLRNGGLISLTGAKASLEGTPGMIGYGLAKAAVHQLVKSLACPGSGLPSNSVAVGILPITLDTPMNRKFMPKADFSSWTPLSYVAELLYNWASGKNRPESGSLAQLITECGVSKVVIA